MSLLRLALSVMLPAVLLLASSALASEADDFQLLLQHAGLPESVQLPPKEALTPDKARSFWRGLLESPVTLRTFAPRTALARLVREAIAAGKPLPYAELLARTRRFRHLVLVRPDGYVVTALTGKPLARLGPPTLYEGELYAQGLRMGAFHFNNGGVFFAVDEALQKQGVPVGELPLGRDPATAALLGAEDALGEMARGLAALIKEPVRTLEGLSQLPLAVAGVIASSPEYFERYGAMSLEDQVREAARLATHVLTLRGGAAMVGPRMASASRVPVLAVSARGTLVVRELAVSAESMTVVVGAGAASASIVLMAQGSGRGGGAWPPAPSGPGQWTEKGENMSAEAQRYQSLVTGAPEGWTYRVRTGSGPKDYVDFDGFKDGVLLEAKGPGYLELLRRMGGKKWFTGVDEMVDQARRQLSAARGAPIRWHFAEREVADFMRKVFQGEQLGQVKVMHTPSAP